jgi:hypothetical protein
MGRKPYMWRNHWLFSKRKIKPEHRGTPEKYLEEEAPPEDYGDDSPNPFNNPSPPPPPPPAPFV